MATDPERHFARDYAGAREAFLSAADRRGARVAGRPLAVRADRGEELSIDTAYLGPETPERLVVVSSGIHGVEGFAGSAIQHRLLVDQLDGLPFRPDTGILLVHALNPYGFARLRRVNESNVDLNRNFLRHPEEHVANPAYEELHDVINPDRLDPDSEAESRRRLLTFARDHGFGRLQEVLSRGQYTRPEGVQYGGQREEASNRILREIARLETRGAQRVAWVDVHTGLGPFGEVEMITECPPDHAASRRGKAWYGDTARSTAAGESVSPALQGVMELGLAESVPEGCELTAFAAEFGTYDPTRVFWSLRADNWLHHRGDPDSARGHAIKSELLEMFRPSDRRWQSRVLERGARVIDQTTRGLLRS